MDQTDGLYTLASVLNTSELNDTEKNFISKIYIECQVKSAFRVPRMALRPCEQHPDIIDDVNNNETWKTISSLMGEDEFQKMWKHKFVLFEMPNNVRISLNGWLSLDGNPSYGRNEQNGIRQPTDISKGYNPLLLIDRKSYVGTRNSCVRNVIPTNYKSLCEMIEDQETGVPGRDICNDITPIQVKLLKKFHKKSFSLKKFLSRRLQKSQLQSVQINIFVKTLLANYVPRGLIGSKKAFDRMTSNILKFFETNSRFPVRLVTLMRGLSSTNFRRNVFLCKFVLFLTNVFVNRVVHQLFHVTESLKDKRVLFFKKNMWTAFEKKALQDMIGSGVLAESPGVSFGPRVSKLRILYKTKGFRPLVKYSARLKGLRFRLSVCNTLLKQIASRINPGYGHVLNSLHSQWKNLNLPKTEKVYFVRTDVCDAFQSILHGKLLEILNRRLSTLNPILTCRIFKFKCGLRTKSVLQFTRVSPRLHNKTVYCENGKKVYATSYLKAVIIQYIKQNYVSMNRKEIFHQIKGLPQGCYLSSVLCELYLADMDDCYFNHLKARSDILIRGVDDYLYLTSDPVKANTFLQLITEGVPDYGITFQHTKTLTNLGSPVTCFPFFGYKFYPLSRKIEPDFSEWADDMTSRVYLNSKMTAGDLTRRMKMVTHIKLHALILDSTYLHKFVVMKNIYLCSKIHASKYKTIQMFLVENGTSRPSMTESYVPIIAAANVISSKVLYINEDRNCLTRREVKIVVLKAFETVLGSTGSFKSLVEELKVTSGRLLAAEGLPSRFKKLLKSLVKNV